MRFGAQGIFVLTLNVCVSAPCFASDGEPEPFLRGSFHSVLQRHRDAVQEPAVRTAVQQHHSKRRTLILEQIQPDQ